MKRVLKRCLLSWIVTSVALTGVALGATFAEMRQAYERAGAGTDAANAVVSEWLKANDLEAISDFDQLTWLARWIVPQGMLSEQFSVTWTGTIQAPAEGAYTFSTCPYNVNIAEDGYLIQQRLQVWVGNQQVMDTTPRGWVPKGTPVHLVGGTKTALRVEFSFASAVDDRDTYTQPSFAQLCWEGPSLAREIVPTSVLATAKGSSGLDAQYRVTVDGQERTVTQTDPKVDFFWTKKDPVVPADAALRQRLAARLEAMVVDPTYLDSCEQGAREVILQEARLLDSSHRRALFESLMGRPTLMRRTSGDRIGRLCALCRAAAPDQVLEVAGRFAQAYPDPEPVFSPTLDRRASEIQGKMLAQNPSQMSTLEQRYLALPDGRCSLLLAYPLAYAYWSDNRLPEWIDKLQARLDDKSLIGDKRVNWLIARAMAAEFQGNRSGRSYWAQPQLLAGRVWLEEACLVAQTESVRLRAYKELIVRLAATEDLAGATKLLNKLTSKFSSPTSTAALTKWRSEVSRMSGEFRQQHADRESLAQKAYLDSLRGKHQRAIEQRDDAAAARYGKMIQDTEASAK